MDFNIEELDLPTKVHTGVLYIKKTPLYIVEVVEESGQPAELVTVYAAHQPRTSPREEKMSVTPVKAFDIEEVEIGKIKDTTPLGKLATKLNKSKKKIVHVPRPPIFMTTIEDGIDTFTGVEGRGFYEREPDRVSISKKEGISVKHGAKTGVFISFESVTWEKLKIPTQEILEDYQARKTLFFL